jgi:hypothetical protein
LHDIEPYHLWRDEYRSENDERSPFYGKEHSEFTFSNKIYNYFIHPQWDEMGSKTLYLKVLFTDYDEGFAIIELIGEWNDCLYNDIMYLKREIIDSLNVHGINKYIVLCDHVLNFHADDDSYYEEWYEDTMEERGWICMINLLPHVEQEMRSVSIQSYVNLGGMLNDLNWRKLKPRTLYHLCDQLINNLLDSPSHA